MVSGGDALESVVETEFVKLLTQTSLLRTTALVVRTLRKVLQSYSLKQKNN
jgi:hypothetical protein